MVRMDRRKTCQALGGTLGNEAQRHDVAGGPKRSGLGTDLGIEHPEDSSDEWFGPVDAPATPGWRPSIGWTSAVVWQ
jgi:hypothetical protein